VADIQIDIEGYGVGRIYVYADSEEERQSGLQRLLDIEPELKAIEQKLGSTAGQRALGSS
jgi:hypothetical protein